MLNETRLLNELNQTKDQNSSVYDHKDCSTFLKNEINKRKRCSSTDVVQPVTKRLRSDISYTFNWKTSIKSRELRNSG